MKKTICLISIIMLFGSAIATAAVNNSELDKMGKGFFICTPYKSPQFPDGPQGIAQRQIWGWKNEKCHYSEYGYYGPQRTKIAHDCYFSKDDLKILQTINHTNYAKIMMPYFSDSTTCHIVE